MKQFLSILQNFLKKYKIKPLTGGSHNYSLSLKELKKEGLVFKPISPEKVKKEYLIDASQIPIHILPHIKLLRRGVYQIQFSSAIQSQIEIGTLNVTGGVARTPQGQIVKHGTGINPATLTSAVVLYQVGVIAFGAHQLSQINQSLEKMNKKLDNISSFLQDRRSFEIRGSIMELSHLFKGILEFKKLGNNTEVLNRIDIIKDIRKSNISNLLHLQKNLQDKLAYLNTLKRTSWFKQSKKEFVNLLDSIKAFEAVFIDYSRSLLLDISCTKTEVSFSICHSVEETKSRLSVLKNQTNFLEQRSFEFEKLLRMKLSTLIKDSWSNDNAIQNREKTLKARWRKIKQSIYDFNKVYRKHIKSIEDIVKPNKKSFFLQIQDLAECKKTA